MNVMVLDAEYNQPSRKTIQIGVAAFDARSATLLETLELFVNPGEPISEPITRLTGITDQDVSNGVSIKEAYEEIQRFHKKHKCFRNPFVWGSGNRNDSQHIYEEYVAATGYGDENFMGFRVIDVKTIYQSCSIFENSKHGGGLKDSMKRHGLAFEGDEHRALTDALNTFKLWYHLMRMFHDGSKVKKHD